MKCDYLLSGEWLPLTTAFCKSLQLMFTYASTSLKSVGVTLKPIYLQALGVNITMCSSWIQLTSYHKTRVKKSHQQPRINHISHRSTRNTTFKTTADRICVLRALSRVKLPTARNSITLYCLPRLEHWKSPHTDPFIALCLYTFLILLGARSKIILEAFHIKQPFPTQKCVHWEPFHNEKWWAV